MTRNERVLNAFYECVKAGIFSPDYVVTMVENQSAYGFLTEPEKTALYAEIEAWERRKAQEAITSMPEMETIPPLVEPDMNVESDIPPEQAQPDEAAPVEPEPTVSGESESVPTEPETTNPVPEVPNTEASESPTTDSTENNAQ